MVNVNICAMTMNRYIALSGLGNFSYIITQGFVRRGGLHPGLWVLCPSRTGGGTLTFKKVEDAPWRAHNERKSEAGRRGCFKMTPVMLSF
jgi:hypothetical protein